MALIYISVGSRFERERHIAAAFLELHHLFGAVRCSRVFESEAVGFSGSPFYNLVVETQTTLQPADCVLALKTIEQRYGALTNPPCTEGKPLDLDLLSYDQHVCVQPVALPRADIVKHAFVLQPLAELAPDWWHPVEQKSSAQLWAEFHSEQKLWPIEFVWPDPTVVLPQSLLPADAQPVCI